MIRDYADRMIRTDRDAVTKGKKRREPQTPKKPKPLPRASGSAGLPRKPSLGKT